MKKTYTIKLSGCDDETIFDVQLTDEEVILLKRIEVKSDEASTCGCMPILTISEVGEEE